MDWAREYEPAAGDHTVGPYQGQPLDVMEEAV